MMIYNILILGLIILIINLNIVNSFNSINSINSYKNINSRIRRKKTIALNVVDHLINCETDLGPAITSIIGRDMCIVREGSFDIARGFVDQVFTIGFLIMSYFFFKRTANGIIDFDEDDDVIDDDDNTNDDDELFPRDANNNLRCPKCDGSGKFSWGNTMDQCDLCYGSGTLSIRMKNKNIKGLPPIDNNWLE